MTKRRVNVYFSDEIYSELARIAKERGKTLSDVLRDAVTLEKYVADAKREGGRVLVEKSDGETRELLVR
jgi:predicted CopG family antitoxin